MGSPPTVERLGRYRLLRRIGRGGMATVYHAVQEGPHGFENEVAVKLVHAELLAAYPHVLEMLVDEARIAARIRHPNVVRILDLVEEAERFYMVMDFVDGMSMRQVLDAARSVKGPIPLEPVLEVLSLACRGLQAAHEQGLPDGTPLGLVHRDVKPGNILVSIRGEVKVGDFGIALFGDRLAESTAHGQLKGTPAYMSPEQVMGETLDARSDVFSMGLTLYTLVTTKLAFTGTNPMKIAMKIASESLDPHADELDELLPGLGDVFAKATQKEPELRYQTAEELGDVLRDLYRSIEAPVSIAEMLAGAGWRPVNERGEPVVPDWPEPAEEDNEDEDTDPGLGDDDDVIGDGARPLSSPRVASIGPEAPTVDEEPPDEVEFLVEEPTTDGPLAEPAAAEPQVEVLEASAEPAPAPPPPPEDPEVTPPMAVRFDEDEPTVAGPDPQRAAEVEVILPGEGGFPGAPPPRPAGVPPHTGVAPPPPGPVPLGTQQRPPPGMAPPPRGVPPHTGVPPGMAPPGGPHPGASGPWRPPPQAPYPGQPRPGEQTMHPPPSAPQPRMQPVRDYRGRVVRKKAPSAKSLQVSQLEKLGVAVAFFLLVATVLAIVLVQLKADPAVDPRFVEGESELAPDAANSTAPAATATPAPKGSKAETSTAAAEPTPDATPAPTPAPTAKERKSRADAPRPTPSRIPVPDEVETPAARPVGKGTLTVNTYPYSQVYVNGASKGRTPLVSSPLKAGSYTVKLVFPTLDGEEIVETIEVKPGEETRLVHRLSGD
jgi:eukaryotic-like serine/threonine-protein kinase